MLSDVVRALLPLRPAVVVATAGRVAPQTMMSSKTVVFDFVSGAALPACRSGRLQRRSVTNLALRHGDAGDRRARNMDQFLNMRAVVRQGSRG